MKPPKKRPTISTGTGDGGETVLLGGTRISKASPRIHAHGAIDELNVVIGLVLAESGIKQVLREQLLTLQRLLFRMGADLAAPASAQTARVQPEDIAQIEQWGVEIEEHLPPLHRFILPGGSRAGAILHLARTVCRRAERRVVFLAERETVNAAIQVCLNRMSDYFFLAARMVNRDAGVTDSEV